MKKFSQVFILVVSLFVQLNVWSQFSAGANCSSAPCNPAPNGSYTNLSAPSMGSYSCLGSTPNPSWMAFGIATSGSVNFQIQQVSNGGNLIDVDFALYGPYTSISAGCPVIGPSTPTVDCSFSASATEQVNIANAIAGQVYILLVTNYSGQPGNINFTQQSSTGTTNCATNFSATTSSTVATCNQPTGSVTATPVGGYAPYTYSWNIPGNPTTPTVNNVAPGTYTVTVTSSPGPNGATVNPTTATVTVGNQNATFSATTTPASCPGGNDGTATANFNAGGAPGVTATYQWSDLNAQTTQTATGLTQSNYVCNISLSNGCSGIAIAIVGANQVNYSSSSTLVSCPGGNDGTAIATMTPAVGNLSYTWNDPSGQTTQQATNLAAGTYTCQINSSVGCTGTQTVTVSEIPGMIANFTTISDVTCNSGNDGNLTVSVSQGTTPYTYAWDNSSSTINIADDLFAGTHTVTITDGLGCVITNTEILGEPDSLKITFLTPDTQICSEDDLLLEVIGSGGSSPYIYNWYENGTLIGSGATITVDPVDSGTNYCVELSEQCGSPVDNKCMTITFPTPIVPHMTPNKIEDCVVGEFEFWNTSQNASEIATTYIEFGDFSSSIEQGSDSVYHEYELVGTYSMNLVTTSIYGCVYEASLPDIVNVVPNPTAQFFFSDNPASVFETTVQAFDKSTADVVSWEWNAPGAMPAQSSFQNPTFVYPENVEGEFPVQLIVTSNYGCTDTLEQILGIVDELLLFAPNTFTPDGDEFNQTWKIKIKSLDFGDFNVQIFNRWGDMVWESNDPNIGWDGTYNNLVAPSGTYTWKATLTGVKAEDKSVYTGNINLLR